MVFRLRGCVWGYFVSSCVFFFFWVFVGMCLVDGSLAKRVAKALIPIDVYFFGSQNSQKHIQWEER